MKLTILPLGVRINGEIVHTREMRLSSVRSAAACARHNYIMRCTLARPEDLRRTRPRERTRSVPMGTSNEMVVTVSHPAKVVAGMCHAGGCALLPGRGDTGPPNPPQLLSTPAICYRSMNRADESGPVGTEVAVTFERYLTFARRYVSFCAARELPSDSVSRVSYLSMGDGSGRGWRVAWEVVDKSSEECYSRCDNKDSCDKDPVLIRRFPTVGGDAL